MSDQKLISMRELSMRTGICPAQLRVYRDTEGMPVYRLGKRRQAIIPEEFYEWLRARKVSNTVPNRIGANPRS